MRLHCRTAADKRFAKTIRHKWFAWYPVQLLDSDECAWLETVWRVGKYHQNYDGDYFWSYEYFSRF